MWRLSIADLRSRLSMRVWIGLAESKVVAGHGTGTTAVSSRSLPTAPVRAGILADQLADLKAGLFISMPIGIVLAAVILVEQIRSGGGLLASFWFAASVAVSGGRIALALGRSDASGGDEDTVSAALVRYGLLALLSGIIWTLPAVLTHGYTNPHWPLYLIVLAGACAGSVTYGAAYAPASLNFMVPPLLVAAGCLVVKGDTDSYILTFTVILFLGGMVRSAFIGQARFCETSRLKHEAKAFAAEMQRTSRLDPLTDLLNRSGLEQAVSRLGPEDGPFVVMLIDLDGFKSVNDTYGHSVGDELLVNVAATIDGHAPEGATIARIGGDEFVLLFSAEGRIQTEVFAGSIISAIASQVSTLNSVRIGASIGIYVSDKPHLTEMLLRADFALYAAKRRGRNEYCFFDQELEEALERKHCIERDLRSAIEAGAVCSWFQPVLRLDTNATVGFEALLRWQHPLHGFLSPPAVVNAARETGLQSLLTETVLLNCCSMIEELIRSGRGHMRVAMNLSPRELEAGNVDDMILGTLAAKNIPAAMLEIEITEEAPIDRGRVDRKLERLADAGISIVLDDFGTGFSTLLSLKDSRIRKIKIDQNFVRNLSKSAEDQALVKAVIDLGQALEIDVMAEGVETDEDRLILVSLGCLIAQGYLFSAAVPMDRALSFTLEPDRALRLPLFTS